MQPALRTQAAVSMQTPGGAVAMPAFGTPASAALLGPFPVLATMMRQELERNAMAYVQGAGHLIDFSMSDDDNSDSSSMADSVMTDSISLPPLTEQSIGATAMVGAAAAAVTLLKLRGGL